MNGNDYLEIEEEHHQEIFEDYLNSLEYDDIPQEFITKWVEKYTEYE